MAENRKIPCNDFDWESTFHRCCALSFLARIFPKRWNIICDIPHCIMHFFVEFAAVEKLFFSALNYARRMRRWQVKHEKEKLTKWLLTWWYARRQKWCWWQSGEVTFGFDGTFVTVTTVGRTQKYSESSRRYFGMISKTFLNFFHPTIQQVLLQNLWIFENRHHHTALLLSAFKNRKFKFSLERCESERVVGSWGDGKARGGSKVQNFNCVE